MLPNIVPRKSLPCGFAAVCNFSEASNLILVYSFRKICDLYFAVSSVWGGRDVECETMSDIWIYQTVYPTS
jgi:hypothetical protein